MEQNYLKISMTMEVKEFWIFDKIVLNRKEGVKTPPCRNYSFEPY